MNFPVDDVTVTLMAQEKICMSRFNATHLCSNLSRFEQLPEFEGRTEFIRQKDIILAEVTHFSFYQQIINTFPVILTSIFISSWADKHSNSCKIILTLSAIMSILESATMLICSVYFNSNVYLMLLSSIYFPLVGGNQGFIMAIMSYLSSTTKASSRVKRFSMLEFTFIIAFPAGVFVGGQIVNSPNLTEFARSNGALHNYHNVFLLSILGKIISLIYALTMRFKSLYIEYKTPESSIYGTSSDSSYRNSISDYNDSKLETHESSSLLHRQKFYQNFDKTTEDQSSKIKCLSTYRLQNNSFSNLFSWQNVRESFDVVFRYRPNGIRIHIWLLIATMSIFVMVARSVNVVMFQFVQKLYSWDAGHYSTINSFFFISTHIIGLLVIIPMLRKIFKANDITLLLLGLLSYMSQNFIRGAIKSVNWFYASYAIGAITPVVSVASRSHLSKLAPIHELNRIFGALSLLETLMPIFGTAIFTEIFVETISFYPGAAHISSALILVIPFLFTAYLGIREARIINKSKMNIKRKDTNNNLNSISNNLTNSFEESLETVVYVK